MSLKTLFGKIGAFFNHVFDGARRTYNRLTPEIRNALVEGSGIISVINSRLENPDGLLGAVLEAYPNIPEEKLKEGLAKAAEGIGVALDATSSDLNHLLTVVQQKLAAAKSENGKKWAAWSSLGAKLISAVLAPEGTKWAVFESLMEFVFRTFVKPKA